MDHCPTQRNGVLTHAGTRESFTASGQGKGAALTGCMFYYSICDSLEEAEPQRPKQIRECQGLTAEGWHEGNFGRDTDVLYLDDGGGLTVNTVKIERLFGKKGKFYCMYLNKAD